MVPAELENLESFRLVLRLSDPSIEFSIELVLKKFVGMFHWMHVRGVRWEFDRVNVVTPKNIGRCLASVLLTGVNWRIILNGRVADHPTVERRNSQLLDHPGVRSVIKAGNFAGLWSVCQFLSLLIEIVHIFCAKNVPFTTRPYVQPDITVGVGRRSLVPLYITILVGQMLILFTHQSSNELNSIARTTFEQLLVRKDELIHQLLVFQKAFSECNPFQSVRAGQRRLFNRSKRPDFISERVIVDRSACDFP